MKAQTKSIEVYDQQEVGVLANKEPQISKCPKCLEEVAFIRQGIGILFQQAKEGRFEDGMESNFSRRLIAYIQEYKEIAINAVAEIILGEKTSPEVASEALRWLAEIDDPLTYSNRLFLLESSLRCSTARVRDGATLGLASLDDPHAIRSLEMAIQVENYAELRKDMEQVLAQVMRYDAFLRPSCSV